MTVPRRVLEHIALALINGTTEIPKGGVAGGDTGDESQRESLADQLDDEDDNMEDILVEPA